MKETFKTVRTHPDYLVSNLGRVKTKKRSLRYTHAVTGHEHFRISEERFLKVQHNNRTGYKFVQLYLNKKMYNRNIHRLVALGFLRTKEGKDYVNHKDGNKHNNISSNLEWCANEYNHQHATATGLKAKGGEVGTSKLNDICVSAIKRLLKNGANHYELAEAFNVSRPTITLISLNKTWKHIVLK